MAYRHWGSVLVCAAWIASLSACGDDVEADAAIDTSTDSAIDGAIEDAAVDDGPSSIDAGPTALGDASMDADVPDAHADADASSDDGGAVDASDNVPNPDAETDSGMEGGATDPIDPDAVSVAVDYQVRCLDCQPTAPDSPVRRFDTNDGGPEVAVECEVVQHGAERMVSFSIRHTDLAQPTSNFALSVRNANLDPAGDPGVQCEIRVEEGSNEYRGRCADTAPTSSDPCELHLSLDGTDLTGSLLCHNIQHKMLASIVRHVVAATTVEEPATFALHGCRVPES